MAEDTRNFKVSEFKCKCGCGYDKIDQRVIDMAQTIRDALGVPVRVNSGCRCEKNNKACNGAKYSKHLKGLAADLSCSLGAKKMFKTIKELKAYGKLPDLDYCKCYSRWVHIDCGGKRRNMWEVQGE